MRLGLVWRVVWRELAVAARHKWLWLVRVGWIGGLALWAMHRVYKYADSYHFGDVLSLLISELLLGEVLLITVLIAARAGTGFATERREGTLGLLLMTDLRPWGLVTGKWCSYMLEVCTLLGASVPVLMSVLAFGGATPRELLNVLADLLILAGFWAAWMMAWSTHSRSPVRAFALGILSYALICWHLYWMWEMYGMVTIALPLIPTILVFGGIDNRGITPHAHFTSRLAFLGMTVIMLCVAQYGAGRELRLAGWRPASEFWARIYDNLRGRPKAMNRFCWVDLLSSNPVFRWSYRQSGIKLMLAALLSVWLINEYAIRYRMIPGMAFLSSVLV